MMGQKDRQKRPEYLITASEVAAYVYCRESWRLEHGLGLPASNEAARNVGTRHHGRKAIAERVAGGGIVVGRWLAVLAVLALLLVLLGLVWR